MRRLLLSLAGILLLAACVPVPRLGEREALPTAVVGVASPAADSLTPISRRAKAGGTPGPLSTPAPWATPVPPTPRPAPILVGHDVVAKSDCLSCHGGRRASMPRDHSKRTNTTCLGCHGVAGAGQVQVVRTVVPKTESPDAD